MCSSLRPVHACAGRFTRVLSGQPPTVPRPQPLSMGNQVQRFRRCLRAVHLVSAKLGFAPDLRLQSQDCLARGPCCWEHPKRPQLQSPPCPPGTLGAGWGGLGRCGAGGQGWALLPPPQPRNGSPSWQPLCLARQPARRAFLPPWELGDQTGDAPRSARGGQPEGGSGMSSRWGVPGALPGGAGTQSGASPFRGIDSPFLRPRGWGESGSTCHCFAAGSPDCTERDPRVEGLGLFPGPRWEPLQLLQSSHMERALLFAQTTHTLPPPPSPPGPWTALLPALPSIPRGLAQVTVLPAVVRGRPAPVASRAMPP